jgi:hypothetical protein
MQASAELRRWTVEYALTPASEQRVKPVEEPDAASDFDWLGTAGLPRRQHKST